MRYMLLTVAAASLAVPVLAQDAAPPPSPGEIAAAAKPDEWVAIDAADLLVMDLAPDGAGKARRVVIQLMPPPFSQGWIGNIRKLAAAHWWDGTSVNRVQDNYVAQWGDATEKKPLPEGLAVVPESEYVSHFQTFVSGNEADPKAYYRYPFVEMISAELPIAKDGKGKRQDGYGYQTGFSKGWPVVGELSARATGKYQPALWPVHCYGAVGVGRNMSPDTGSGAELYAVIGHAPRHLDRNIALVGRVISGIEHLSSLPRGTEALGFYAEEKERVPIVSIRIASELPAAEQPKFEYLSTESDSFARYADARANRRDPFFIAPAGGADICNIPVPVRAVAAK
ncbi:peptidylprolyl isomerase [Sphingopyxis macrogoltabida]|uniref:Peptidylprolyl isomerase n=1 Tax=Sphingopyxis macrogoltabida TaxID=33050 RepID=A0AAC8YZR5_SPHMC|nr:peptidylprolyl isomerase [Sphingopyxis macrogoltabida]ALJ13325.1 peptidylprolyl isomerase [Sphingopyxis macrogoltabida]AMU89211.1 peptidylprolyl isomerase [Sphingopyxis macrogoltabida]